MGLDQQTTPLQAAQDAPDPGRGELDPFRFQQPAQLGLARAWMALPYRQHDRFLDRRPLPPPRPVGPTRAWPQAVQIVGIVPFAPVADRRPAPPEDAHRLGHPLALGMLDTAQPELLVRTEQRGLGQPPRWHPADHREAPPIPRRRRCPRLHLLCLVMRGSPASWSRKHHHDPGFDPLTSSPLSSHMYLNFYSFSPIPIFGGGRMRVSDSAHGGFSDEIPSPRHACLCARSPRRHDYSSASRGMSCGVTAFTHAAGSGPLGGRNRPNVKGACHACPVFLPCAALDRTGDRSPGVATRIRRRR